MNEFDQSPRTKPKVNYNTKKSTKKNIHYLFREIDDDKYYDKEIEKVHRINSTYRNSISSSDSSNSNSSDSSDSDSSNSDSSNSDSSNSDSSNSTLNLGSKNKDFNKDYKEAKFIKSDDKSAIFINSKESKFFNLELNKVTSLNNILYSKSIV